MPVTVSLQDVVDAMDTPNDQWESFLNPDTGEIVSVSAEDRSALETDDPEALPEWQRQAQPKIQEALESDRFLRLPSQFEIDEWSIMERFAQSLDEPKLTDQLLDAIHGSGAFRLFRQSIRRLGIEDDWYRFREESLRTIAREWLATHGIGYT